MFCLQPLNVDGVKIAWRYKAQLMEKSLSGSDGNKVATRNVNCFKSQK